jgi:hypothetical protein
LAERIRGEDANNEDVDAFLKESRDSLHGKYWGPDSLAPVRMVDMRDEPPPPPVRKPLRVRPLDIVLGAAGLCAAALLGFSFRHDKQPAPAALVAPAVPARKAAPATVTTASLAVTREVAAPVVTPPPSVVEATPPAIAEAPPSAVLEAQTSGALVSSAATPDPSPLGTSSAAASAEPPPAPKKRRPKPAPSHAPPTASFPD